MSRINRLLLKQTDDLLGSYRDDVKERKPKFQWNAALEKEFLNQPLLTLIEDDYFLGLKDELWDAHKGDILDLWEARRERKVKVAVFEEGIGSGKTFKAGVISWLLVYEVVCHVEPMRYYGLSRKSAGIGNICMSRNHLLAKEVTFQSFLPFFNCPFFKDYFPPQVDFDKMEETQRFPSRLKFPGRIAIFPGTGSEASALGYSLRSGTIDEINHMEVFDESKRAVIGREYDVGMEIFGAIEARVDSRFSYTDPGLIVCLSNSRYPKDFTDRMRQRAEKDVQIFFRSRSLWEAKPKKFYSGVTFEFDTDTMGVVEG